MNREPISYYLRNPSKLVDISVSQIEKWLQESPYSQPIRILLAKKLHYNQEVILDPVIAGAATMASNRTWLYREVYEKIEYKTENNPTTDSAEVEDEIEETIETTIPTTILDAGAIAASQEEELIEEVEEIIETVVAYEEVLIEDTLDEAIQSTENEYINEASATNESEEDDISKNEGTEEEISENIETSIKSEDTEPKQEDIIAEEEKLEPTIATLDVKTSEPKLIDLDSTLVLDHKAINELRVEFVGPDEDFITSKKKDKKDKKKKNSKDKKKIKKDKLQKVKKKKSDKKDEKKDKKKSVDKKSSKKVKAKKKAKKEKSRRKALVEYWDNKVGTIAPPPGYKKKKKSKSKSTSKKKSKIKLSKYDISVSPSEEEANQYSGDSGEMSEYTQWLMTFGKDKDRSSLRHMATHSSKKTTKIEDISFVASEPKSKKQKSKQVKKEKKSRNKSKSKADQSLETKEEIISELWADLLAKQGHIKKARKMYLKLSLKYPEKSSYFARKLENL